MRELATDPVAFLAPHRSTPSLRSPALIVSASAFAGAGGVLVVLIELSEALSGPTARFLLTGLAIGWVSTLIGGIVAWPAITIGCHAVARRLGGAGELRPLLALVGWGYLPQLLAGAFGTLALSIVLSGTTLPSEPGAAASAVAALRTRPLVRIAAMLSAPATVWSGVYWVHAVSHVHDLDRRQAAAAVAGPVVLSLGLTFL